MNNLQKNKPKPKRAQVSWLWKKREANNTVKNAVAEKVSTVNAVEMITQKFLLVYPILWCCAQPSLAPLGPTAPSVILYRESPVSCPGV